MVSVSILLLCFCRWRRWRQTSCRDKSRRRSARSVSDNLCILSCYY